LGGGVSRRPLQVPAWRLFPQEAKMPRLTPKKLAKKAAKVPAKKAKKAAKGPAR
jgi:hypothetical protein